MCIYFLFCASIESILECYIAIDRYKFNSFLNENINKLSQQERKIERHTIK